MNEPIHILSLGAGVQSSTLALMAAAGEEQVQSISETENRGCESGRKAA